ncbi:MAG: carbohydrate-binding family 9-like protein [Bacteroidales bacterium]|nr:diguanylate cyclase [Bacteroidales bacterium]
MNKREYSHEVYKISGTVSLTGEWNSPEWRKHNYIELDNFMGSIPLYKPVVRVRTGYDEDNLFLIFRTEERFARCITTEINGPVWRDSAVELFFSPDIKFPERYFNLEINCGGTPLLHYNLVPRRELIEIPPEEISEITINHSLPAIVDPEIISVISWIIECKIPFSLLRRYSDVTTPVPGVTWKANFYKVAVNNSNPHYMTWSPVKNDIPDFHLPFYFGNLIFR